MSTVSEYQERGSCRACNNTSLYQNLSGTEKTSCDLPCLCRFNDERSTKDKLYYNWFVLNQPMNLPAANGGVVPMPTGDGSCNNNQK